MKAVRLKIKGRVQGVFYRMWMMKNAEQGGVEGWVRNTEDGSVEALLQGDAELVDRLVEKCRNGSKLAKVTDIEETIVEFEPEIEGFSVLR